MNKKYIWKFLGIITIIYAPLTMVVACKSNHNNKQTIQWGQYTNNSVIDLTKTLTYAKKYATDVNIQNGLIKTTKYINKNGETKEYSSFNTESDKYIDPLTYVFADIIKQVFNNLFDNDASLKKIQEKMMKNNGYYKVIQEIIKSLLDKKYLDWKNKDNKELNKQTFKQIFNNLNHISDTILPSFIAGLIKNNNKEQSAFKILKYILQNVLYKLEQYILDIDIQQLSIQKIIQKINNKEINIYIKTKEKKHKITFPKIQLKQEKINIIYSFYDKIELIFVLLNMMLVDKYIKPNIPDKTFQEIILNSNKNTVITDIQKKQSKQPTEINTKKQTLETSTTSKPIVSINKKEKNTNNYDSLKIFKILTMSGYIKFEKLLIKIMNGDLRKITKEEIITKQEKEELINIVSSFFPVNYKQKIIIFMEIIIKISNLYQM